MSLESNISSLIHSVMLLYSIRYLFISFYLIFIYFYVAVIEQNHLYLHMHFLKELIFQNRHRVIVNECIAMKISTLAQLPAQIWMILFLKCMSIPVVCEGDYTTNYKLQNKWINKLLILLTQGITTIYFPHLITLQNWLAYQKWLINFFLLYFQF